MSEKWKRKMNKLTHTLASLVSPSFREDPNGEALISFTNSAQCTDQQFPSLPLRHKSITLFLQDISSHTVTDLFPIW